MKGLEGYARAESLKEVFKRKLRPPMRREMLSMRRVEVSRKHMYSVVQLL